MHCSFWIRLRFPAPVRTHDLHQLRLAALTTTCFVQMACIGSASPQFKHLATLNAEPNLRLARCAPPFFSSRQSGATRDLLFLALDVVLPALSRLWNGAVLYSLPSSSEGGRPLTAPSTIASAAPRFMPY